MKQRSDALEPSRATTAPETIDPGLPIIDSHHHLWHPHADRYLIDAFQADIEKSGHRLVATVYVEGGAMHRQHGPEVMRTVGEAEFVAGLAAMSASGAYGPTRCCEAFVGAADLTLGERADEVLDALDTASGRRLRGIRGTAIWDADASVNSGARPYAPRGLLLDPNFRAGVARLAERKLVYDAWQYYPQLPELCSLADALPTATLVVNHCGGLLGVGPYATPENFANWKRMVTEAARRPNILMKLGGLTGRRTGFGYEGRLTCPILGDLVADWKPYVETCIELFGAHRCMFETNFPVDKIAGDYQMIWNVFKTITMNCSPEEKANLFSETARSTCRMS